MSYLFSNNLSRPDGDDNDDGSALNPITEENQEKVSEMASIIEDIALREKFQSLANDCFNSYLANVEENRVPFILEKDYGFMLYMLATVLVEARNTSLMLDEECLSDIAISVGRGFSDLEKLIIKYGKLSEDSNEREKDITEYTYDYKFGFINSVQFAEISKGKKVIVLFEKSSSHPFSGQLVVTNALDQPEPVYIVIDYAYALDNGYVVNPGRTSAQYN